MGGGGGLENWKKYNVPRLQMLLQYLLCHTSVCSRAMVFPRFGSWSLVKSGRGPGKGSSGPHDSMT